MNVSFDHFEVISSLNFDQVRLKLMHVESGEGWDLARAEAAESEYRRFLYLTRKYPEERIAPTVDADTFWHYHILDTVKYAHDCQEVFGYFLHHDPYVGIGEEAPPGEQIRAGERMWELYEAEFGRAQLESNPQSSAWCTVTAPDADSSRAFASKKTAWCTVTGTRAKTAWCTLANPKARTAWCTVTADGAKTAWCTVTTAKAKTAWCTVTGTRSKTAWCTVTARTSKTAWCTVTANDAMTVARMNGYRVTANAA
jgi:hypothetical protein